MEKNSKYFLKWKFFLALQYICLFEQKVGHQFIFFPDQGLFLVVFHVHNIQCKLCCQDVNQEIFENLHYVFPDKIEFFGSNLNHPSHSYTLSLLRFHISSDNLSWSVLTDIFMISRKSLNHTHLIILCYCRNFSLSWLLFLRKLFIECFLILWCHETNQISIFVRTTNHFSSWEKFVPILNVSGYITVELNFFCLINMIFMIENTLTYPLGTFRCFKFVCH